MKLLARLTFTASLFTALLASAPAGAEEPAPTPVPTYAKRTLVNFSEVKLTGEVVRPEDSYINVRRRSHFVAQLKLRQNFLPEILNSVEAIR